MTNELRNPTALVADDEPLLREALCRQLGEAWPGLEVIAQARNGREALEQFEALQPAVCFLDVHMPVLSGIEVARAIGRRAHIVFVTAFDQYAVEAFAQGALDYLVKPVDPARLADTIGRVQERLHTAGPREDVATLLEQLAVRLQPAATTADTLKWLRVGVGQTTRLLLVDEIDFLRSDEKYTQVGWRGEGGKPMRALIRSSLRDLVPRLDPQSFAQVHRAVVVNLRAISHVTRDAQDSAEIHLKGQDETLPVSRSYLHLFRQM